MKFKDLKLQTGKGKYEFNKRLTPLYMAPCLKVFIEEKLYFNLRLKFSL